LDGDKTMVIGTNSLAYVIGLLWTFSAAAAAAEPSSQQASAEPKAPAETRAPAENLVAKLAQMEFPQVAEVIGNDVNIRSGPGTSYYRCGKLNAGDKVIVVDILHNAWAKIVPPEGSYSWISKTYVQLNPNNPKIGVLTGDDVRVWAGSDFVEPLHSHSQQVKLYKGDLVELVGPPDLDADYYKIKPPADAYLWVSMEQIKLLGPVSAQKPAQPPAEEKTQAAAAQPSSSAKPAAAAAAPTQPAQPAAPQPEQAASAPGTPEAEQAQPAQPAQLSPPPAPSVETLAIQKCTQLKAAIEEELKKPLPEQDYTAYKEDLQKMIQTPDVGRAKLYAESLLKQIERYELAIEVHKQLQQQDQTLQEIRAKIAAAHQTQRERAVPAEAKYLFVGTLQPSHIYTGKVGPRRYVVMDQNKRILCYLLPKDPSLQPKLDSLTDKIVGVKGTILDDPKAMIPVVLLEEVEAIFE